MIHRKQLAKLKRDGKVRAIQERLVKAAEKAPDKAVTPVPEQLRASPTPVGEIVHKEIARLLYEAIQSTPAPVIHVEQPAPRPKTRGFTATISRDQLGRISGIEGEFHD